MTQHPPAISSLCWWLDVARPWALMLRRFLRELLAFGGTCSSHFNVSLQCQGHKQVLSSCMPGYFSFDFKNSILLACSQGCYSALQLATERAAEKRGGFYMVYPNSALLGLSEIYLNFISVWLLIYKTASFFFFFFQNNPLLICWDLEPEQQMGPTVTVKHRAGRYLASTSASTKWYLCSGIKDKVWESSSAQKFIKTQKQHWEWSAMQIPTVWYGSAWSWEGSACFRMWSHVTCRLV